MNSSMLANDATDLWTNGLDRGVSLSQTEVDKGSANVWAGTLTAGTVHATNTCQNWTNGTPTRSGRLGRLDQAGANWINNTDNTCVNEYHIYCISQ